MGATDQQDGRAGFSNAGSCLDLFAPGVGVTSAWIGSDSASNTISGTSMASPHVAGTVALRQQSDAAATPAQLTEGITAGASPDVVVSPGTGSPNRLLFTGSTVVPPAVTVEVDASPDHGRDFAFSVCALGTEGACTDLTLDDDRMGPHLAGRTLNGLAPGRYRITQAPAGRWGLTGVRCDDTASWVAPERRRATFDLAEGEHVTCTFVNTSTALTVIEEADPESPQDFSFERCRGRRTGSPVCDAFVLDDDRDPTRADRVSSGRGWRRGATS